MTKVVLSEGVESIGVCAFEWCSGLKDIIISDSVTSIGGDAFCCCTSLEEIFIPISVINMGSYVFEDDDNLKNINLESTVYPSTWQDYHWKDLCYATVNYGCTRE